MTTLPAATRTSDRPLSVALYPPVPGRRPTTVSVTGRVVRGLLVPLEACVARALVEAVEHDPAEVAVDVLGVTALDAAGVGVLFEARRQADAAGVALTLRGGHRPVVRDALRASQVRTPFRTPSRGTAPARPATATPPPTTRRRSVVDAVVLVAHEGGPRAGQVDQVPTGHEDRYLVYDGPRWFGVYARSAPLRTHVCPEGTAEVWTHLG